MNCIFESVIVGQNILIHSLHCTNDITNVEVRFGCLFVLFRVQNHLILLFILYLLYSIYFKHYCTAKVLETLL